MKTELEQLIEAKGEDNRLTFAAHFGEAVVGRLAYRNRFVISPQVFRCWLKPATKKHSLLVNGS